MTPLFKDTSTISEVMSNSEKLKLAAKMGISFPHFTNTDNPIDFPMTTSKLKHVKGNLLDLAEAGEFDVVVQGCNCFNKMGGGIAREIRERYPEVAAVDSMTDRGDYNKLGDWTSEIVIRNNGTTKFEIVNAYTQYNMSTGEDVFEYTAFALILQKLARRYPKGKFGFPYIGMGLAKGDKDVIMTLLDAFAEAVNATGGTVTLVEFA
jgi:O-acetyl-ADP-ribose deacetylase (regulator of RNase III)